MKHLGEQEKERYKQLLQKYAEGQPVICQAAREGNLDDVKFFVEVLKEDVNQVAVGGVSPLIMASWANKIEVVNYLVSLDEVDLNMANHSGATAPCGHFRRAMMLWQKFCLIVLKLICCKQMPRASPPSGMQANLDAPIFSHLCFRKK